MPVKRRKGELRALEGIEPESVERDADGVCVRLKLQTRVIEPDITEITHDDGRREIEHADGSITDAPEGPSMDDWEKALVKDSDIDSSDNGGSTSVSTGAASRKFLRNWDQIFKRGNVQQVLKNRAPKKAVKKKSGNKKKL